MARRKTTLPSILVVDDEPEVLAALQEILEFEGYAVEAVGNAAKALELLKKKEYRVILSDVKMPGMDGLELLNEVRSLHPSTPVIMISGHGTIEMAVEAVRKGAFDFITKPPDLQRLLIAIRNALERNRLQRQAQRLKRRVRGLREIIGESSAIRRVKQLIERVAPTEARVLILGESGTGKELVARWIHELSSRNEAPFVEVNCAAIPSELIESELFGHERGAFTHAVKRRIGKFEQAHGGTLFLDEIGDMSSAAQAKVLRALQEKKIQRVGGTENIDVDARVIAATNQHLEEAIRNGRFREDLYHRLAVVVIHVPPLRERREDIPLLVTGFMEELAENYQLTPREITKDAMEWLMNLPWRGNVRELRNVIERLMILGGEQIDRHTVEELVGIGDSFQLSFNIHGMDAKRLQQHALALAVKRLMAYYQDEKTVAEYLHLSVDKVKNLLADVAP